jgi:hypothetical protein
MSTTVGAPDATGGAMTFAPNSKAGVLDGGKGLSLVPSSSTRRWPSCDAGSASAALDDSDAGPSPYQDACLIDEAHGVFVDVTRGDDANGDGSRDAPLKSLGAAIRQAVNQAKHVYACNGVYEEPMLIGTSLSNGLAVYGGLSCETFQPDPGGAHTLVRAKGKGAALEIADTRQILVERFDFENIAGDAVAGTSYVGAFIQNAHKVLLREVTLRAASGEAGTDAKAVDALAASGMPGSSGADACAANPNPGGAGGNTNGCFAQSSTTAGGLGGGGAIGSGSGGNGNWLGGSGGGIGEADTSWSCTQGSGMGPSAGPGYAGQPGSGAKGFGALVGSGFVGFSGQAGMPGSPGYAGSGGGGAKAPATCAGLSTPTGASAGGGGSGGCGGNGGKGGGPGGSSFALISIDSDVRLENSTLAYANGGRGGRGAVGQHGGQGAPGGKGGRGSAGSKAACDGGPGLQGGDGGPGGGGNGGHTIGVLYLGRTPKLIDVAGELEAKANKGGASGTGPDGADVMIAPNLVGTEGVSAFSYEM